MRSKQVGIVHLVYILIISILVITFISIIAFGGGKEAGNQMNVAATAVSIILAVIAILMTLVDVAGQRQSITDLKDAGEKLESSTQSANKMFKEAINAVGDFQNAKNDLMDSFADTISRLEEIKQGDTDKINEVIDELKEKQIENISKYSNKNFEKTTANGTPNYASLVSYFKVYSILKSFGDDAVEYDEFVETFSKRYGKEEAMKIIRNLSEDRKIFVVKYDKDGKGIKKVIINI
ncbi:hypothetical protein [Bacillus sp. FCW2]|uniref:hypothetical protein n=1 Tax=Bacillus sp. FCW2 TaxID=2867004 RepID=UPI001E572F16|nr:hypothetical protein [Bacillus sp. FCW2]UHC66766.1 hypothetical protein K3G25_09285 [Bacillus sp. FCW2]